MTKVSEPESENPAPPVEVHAAPEPMPAPIDINKHQILIVGKSSAGKSASLKPLIDPKNIVFLNCEAGKDLPFPAKFRKMTVIDPYQVWDAFDKVEGNKKIRAVIVDSVTFLMDMFESVHVLTAANTMKAWGLYAQFFKTLMQQKAAASTKSIIMTAHTMDVFNEVDGIIETMVKVKGSLMNQGIEAYFTNVVSAKKMAVSKLTSYKNDLLTITPQEEAVGVKYVFQTQLTKETVNERIRAPMGMWSPQETFIDNNAQYLLDRLDEYYHEGEDEV